MSLKYCYPHIDDVELPEPQGQGFCWRALVREHEEEAARLRAGLPPSKLTGTGALAPGVTEAVNDESWQMPSLLQLVSAFICYVENALLEVSPWLLGFLLANVTAKLVIGRYLKYLAGEV